MLVNTVMDSAQQNENFSRSNLIDFTIPKTGGSIAKIKVEENSEKSDSNHVEKSSSDTKLTVKLDKPTHPTSSQMVLESIKSLKIRKGTPAHAILKYIEDHYNVNMKSITPSINKYLETGVEIGILEKVSGSGVDTRFKIKKMEGATAKVKAEKFEKPALKRDRKFSINGKLTPKRKPNHPPTSQMVIESIKSLKMRNGASFQAIAEYMEGHYNVKIKSIKGYIARFLMTGVEKGILEQVSGVGLNGRFKITKIYGSSVKPKSNDAGKLGKLALKKSRDKLKDSVFCPVRKKLNHPPTSEMVIESIKSLKMRNGATLQAIGEYMEGRYNVSLKTMKPRINRFLKTGVQKGILEQVSGVGVDGRFKIKKTGPDKKGKHHLTEPKKHKNKKESTALSRLDFYQ